MKETGMLLSLALAGVVWVVANMSLLYMVLYVHKAPGLRDLWGYAPSQFVFVLLVLPVASFATFESLRLLIIHLQAQPPDDALLRWFARNWIVVMLVGVMVASLVCIVDYARSAKTLDKLEPVYAKHALDSMDRIEEALDKYEADKREEERDKLIRQARKEKVGLAKRLETANDKEGILLASPPEVYLQIAGDYRLQRTLGLTNQAVHALNVFQVLVILVVAVYTLWTTFSCVMVAREYQNALPGALAGALAAGTYAVCLMLLYPIVYAQQRSEMNQFIGEGQTIIPHVFALVIAAFLLFFLATLRPWQEGLMSWAVSKLLPVLVVVCTAGFTVARPQMLRQLIGPATNAGIQILLVICVVIAWVLIAMDIRHRCSESPALFAPKTSQLPASSSAHPPGKGGIGDGDRTE